MLNDKCDMYTLALSEFIKMSTFETNLLINTAPLRPIY